MSERSDMNRMTFRRRGACLLALATTLLAMIANGQEVVVLGGVEQVEAWLKSENWWGEVNRDTQLTVPKAMITGINPQWRTASQKLPVQQKKELFYRFMLPLVVHANGMVMQRREGLFRMKEALAAGEGQTDADMQALREGAALLRITTKEEAAALTSSSKNLAAVLDEAIYKLDLIPAGLVLGQAAYESGYGTSRFASEGNALFGQWTYGGKGLVPEQQRKNLGDHRIAAFDWPFDSVRGYFINLMSHPAYEEFRRLRAQLRADGKPLTSMVLADGLIKYSERGQEYVDTLKGMMRVNRLTIADDAVFRDEPMRFIIGAESEAAAADLRKQVERLRASGELAQIVARMRLE
jgi:Bax protein